MNFQQPTLPALVFLFAACAGTTPESSRASFVDAEAVTPAVTVASAEKEAPLVPAAEAPAETPAEAPVEAAAQVDQDEARTEDVTTVPVAEGTPPVLDRAPRRYQTQFELDIWNEPEMRRRLIESYGANPASEPPTSLEDREVLAELEGWMAKDRIDRALRLLERSIDEDSTAVFERSRGNIYYQLATTDLIPDQDDQGNDLPIPEEDLLAHEAKQAEWLAMAITDYRAAIAKYPSFLTAHKNLGLVLAEERDYAAAIPHLTRVIQLGDQDGNLFGVLGYAYGQTGQHLAAESAYRMATLLQPENFNWKNGLADALRRQKRWPELVSFCDNLLAEKPDLPFLWIWQAQGYNGVGEPLKAAQNYEFVDQLGAATPGVLYRLAGIYATEQVFDPAGRAYIRAIEASSESNKPDALRALRAMVTLRAYEQAGLIADAINLKFEGQLTTEETTAILRQRARIAAAAGAASDQEVATLEQILELNPSDGDAMILLGDAYALRGDVRGAGLQYERAADYEDVEVRALRHHGRMLVREKQYRLAGPLLARAYQLEPADDLKRYIEEVDRLARLSEEE